MKKNFTNYFTKIWHDFNFEDFEIDRYDLFFESNRYKIRKISLAMKKNFTKYFTKIIFRINIKFL